jgi:hypothetical protein
MNSKGFFCRKAADRFIMDYKGHTVPSLSKIQSLNQVMLCSCEFLGCGNNCVACLVSYNVGQYIKFGRMSLCNPLIGKCIYLIIIDTQLMLTLHTLKQSLYAQSLYATNHIVIIDSQYIMSRHFLAIQKHCCFPIAEQSLSTFCKQ